MAKPIEPTPVLTGSSAKAFWDALKSPRFSEKKEKELLKSREIFRFFGSVSNVVNIWA